MANTLNYFDQTASDSNTLHLDGTVKIGDDAVNLAIQSGLTTVTSDDDTAGFTTIATGLTTVVNAIVQVVDSGNNVVTSDADITFSSGNIVVADGVTYAATNAYVIRWIAFGA